MEDAKSGPAADGGSRLGEDAKSGVAADGGSRLGEDAKSGPAVEGEVRQLCATAPAPGYRLAVDVWLN